MSLVIKDQRIAQIISNMSLEQKIGQLIIGQAEGQEMTPSFEDFIRKYQLGGYRIKGSNIKSKEQVRSFTEQIQSVYKSIGHEIALLGSDQEGGSLSVFGDTVTEFPGNMALGATHSVDLAFEQGQATGNELSKLGINFVFAPVADININELNPIIGVRSFGDKPWKVTDLCKSFIKGLNSGGIASCLKHYPGHGNTVSDSHVEIPYNESDLMNLKSGELIPFEILSKQQVDSIMVSHIIFPKIDMEPASVSKTFINDILRTEMSYEGVIMTDDIEMTPMLKTYGIEKTARMFIEAGGDLLLINKSKTNQILAIESLLTAVEEGYISETKINEAVERILNLKMKTKQYRINRRINDKESREISYDISKKAITLIQDPLNLLPIGRDRRILLIQPEQYNISEADTSGGKAIKLFEHLQHFNSNITLKTVDFNQGNINELEFNKNDYDLIIQATINSTIHSAQHEFSKWLSSLNIPLISIALRNPYDIKTYSEQNTIICTYYTNDLTMEALAKLLMGEMEFRGELPVDISYRKC
ncbi:glycoside hydrolase family 3 protein [Paenibacillus motobuensis]|uniref:glycoside hydrolase family 3 protein n=1 Tax=Paenibacillus TaxID=44249 RepID=UPI0020403833|nr:MULTISPECIES: glycoside hydrolase family 3 protein [Paenibacillus]MCM3039602.1 glycoside hydrolase family 3 protein [Paenibacillus lutimineralis]MCM3646706.1 glycoside hydrolase family 3 protein [Paenibacillus motobuensis]